MKYVGKDGCEVVNKVDTDDLCCAISGGNVDGHTLFCAVFSNKCVLYSMVLNDEDQLR
jgi:hypothetical protein